MLKTAWILGIAISACAYLALIAQPVAACENKRAKQTNTPGGSSPEPCGEIQCPGTLVLINYDCEPNTGTKCVQSDECMILRVGSFCTNGVCGPVESRCIQTTANGRKTEPCD